MYTTCKFHKIYGTHTPHNKLLQEVQMRRGSSVTEKADIGNAYIFVFVLLDSVV